MSYCALGVLNTPVLRSFRRRSPQQIPAFLFCLQRFFEVDFRVMLTFLEFYRAMVKPEPKITEDGGISE